MPAGGVIRPQAIMLKPPIRKHAAVVARRPNQSISVPLTSTPVAPKPVMVAL